MGEYITTRPVQHIPSNARFLFGKGFQRITRQLRESRYYRLTKFLHNFTTTVEGIFCPGEAHRMLPINSRPSTRTGPVPCSMSFGHSQADVSGVVHASGNLSTVCQHHVFPAIRTSNPTCSREIIVLRVRVRIQPWWAVASYSERMSLGGQVIKLIWTYRLVFQTDPNALLDKQ